MAETLDEAKIESVKLVGKSILLFNRSYAHSTMNVSDLECQPVTPDRHKFCVLITGGWQHASNLQTAC